MRKHESHSHEMDLSRDYLQDLGYEPRDVSLPVLVKWLVILFVFFGLTAAGTWVMYEVFVAEEPNQNAKTLDVNMRKLPAAPHPLLQANPMDDIHKFRADEEEREANWYWKDRAKGIATMPIDKALEAVAAQGLPTKGQSSPPTSGATPTGEASPAGAAVSPMTTDTIPAPMDGHITNGVDRHGAPAPPR